MVRMTSVLLLLLPAALVGCTGGKRIGSNCEWHDETVRWLDLRSQTQQRHLSDDAFVAEDLAIRYADSLGGPHRLGWDEYHQTRDQCMAALFNVIANNHHVTPGQVRQSLGHRRGRLDLVVVLSFIALYYGVVGRGIASWVHRCFPAGRKWLALAAVSISSVTVSSFGVAIGELWSGALEALRVGNGHLSYRVSRIPWNAHRLDIFIVGVILFLLIALLRYRFSSSTMATMVVTPGRGLTN